MRLADTVGNTLAAYVSLGVLDVVLDVAVSLLPLPMSYKLQVARQAKFALVATFGLGLFTIVAGTMRRDSLRSFS